MKQRLYCTRVNFGGIIVTGTFWTQTGGINCTIKYTVKYNCTLKCHLKRCTVSISRVTQVSTDVSLIWYVCKSGMMDVVFYLKYSYWIDEWINNFKYPQTWGLINKGANLWWFHLIIHKMNELATSSICRCMWGFIRVQIYDMMDAESWFSVN